MSFSLRQLEVLTLFSRTKSVTETARLLRVSQPAVSQTLKDIEREFGFPVLLRTGGRTLLSDELSALLPDIEKMLSQASFLRGRVAELRDSSSGTLAVASVPTLFSTILPRALAAFAGDYAKADISADVRLRDEVLQAVREGQADVGFAMMPFDETGLAVEPLMEMEVACALPADHPLAVHPEIFDYHLQGIQLIVQETHAMQGTLTASLMRRLNPSQRIITTNQSSAALSMVAAGLGIAIIQPIAFYGAPHAGIVFRPVRPSEKIVLAMVYSRRRPVGRLIVKLEKYMRTELDVFSQAMARHAISACRL